jgi:hypothetical protein
MFVGFVSVSLIALVVSLVADALPMTNLDVYHRLGSSNFGSGTLNTSLRFCSPCGDSYASPLQAANSYITVLGPPEYASFRLTLAQGFNGIATVVGREFNHLILI